MRAEPLAQSANKWQVRVNSPYWVAWWLATAALEPTCQGPALTSFQVCGLRLLI
jgi:hypothetical protein